MASRNKYRKYMSGNLKRAIKQKKDDFLNTQRGSLNKYLDFSSTSVVDTNEVEVSMFVYLLYCKYYTKLLYFVCILHK